MAEHRIVEIIETVVLLEKVGGLSPGVRVRLSISRRSNEVKWDAPLLQKEM